MSIPEYIPYQRKKTWAFWLLILIPIILIIGLLLYQIPPVNHTLAWRLDIVTTYIRMLINPLNRMPTPMVYNQILSKTETTVPTETQPSIVESVQITEIPTIIPTATIAPTPLPATVALKPPAYDETRDKQDWNNCGPATMALYLRYYGWIGNQFDVAKVIKPTRDDRNVNVEELVYFVRTQTGWLNAEFRVGGNLDTLRKFISAGIPVMIEETFKTDRKYWLQDDMWAGHYLLITGYDDNLRLFTAQDSEVGPNQKIQYDDLIDHWQSFNHVYILVYPPEQDEKVKNLLGKDTAIKANRLNTLAAEQENVQKEPNNAYAWFNIGTNLVVLERYQEASLAYDKARSIGLPERMLRYQFGPFIAYFHAGRNDELMALTKYALGITRVSEEAMLWRGWGFYRLGDKSAALNLFRDALKIRPGYEDALYALDFVGKN